MSIDIHFLGADGLADVVDVIFSAVIKDVLILFPESDTEIETEKGRERGDESVNFFSFFFGPSFEVKESDDFTLLSLVLRF